MLEMYLHKLLLCLALVAQVKSNEWCYTGCAHSPEHWKDLDKSHCGDFYQSPIDIVTSIVTKDTSLKHFNFTNLNSTSAIKTITNNGHSVQCDMKENELEVSGGGLSGLYSVLQFHFHWSTDNEGSEHTVDDHRYPMEMHIVTGKKDVSATERLNQKDGLAVLGFFINVRDNMVTEDGEMSESWSMLKSYLKDITDEGTSMDVNKNISINDLIKDVDLSKYYRYMGSLTTPKCNEAVVWTLFHEPIQVHKDLLQHFSMVKNIKNNYRPVQPLNGRQITASNATPLPPGWCYDGHCVTSDHSPSHWANLPNSHCDGRSQSPIDIDTKSAIEDKQLTSFTFTNFDNKGAIKSITNTGHTVKCVLKDNMVEVSGGGLDHTYSALQFHFHWGDESSDSAGSEHSLDTKRYPMEMHIVCKRKDLTLDKALQEHDGLAVLGFFIESPKSAKSSSSSDTSDHGDTQAPSSSTASNKEAWKKLTHYLPSIENITAEVEVTDKISIDDLLGDVNRESYFRYSGSLTTPMCNEAVVWTVFKESITVDHELMAMFPENLGYHNVFRPRQSLHSRTVHTTAAATVPGPILFYLLLSCLFAFSLVKSHL